jgi:CRISPR-associated protein Cas2
MMVIVSYDVNTTDKAGRNRLRRVAKACEDFGIRVQLSVFECEVDPAQWADLKHRLVTMIHTEKDSLRFYFLGSNWQRRVEHVGKGVVFSQFEDPLIL